MSSSFSSPCAACKFLRRKCTTGCVFSPYFPPDQPTKFANVHHVFGASNVAKILHDLPPSQREDAVLSLAFEADARIRDPVHGCVASVYNLQTRIKQVQTQIENAKNELYTYIGDAALHPSVPSYIPQFTNCGSVQVNPVQQQIVIREQQLQPQYDIQQHQAQYEVQQQIAAMAVAREHEMDLGGSSTVHAGLGLGSMQFFDDDNGFGIGRRNELHIQVHPQQHMDQNLHGQQHDGRSG